MTTLKETLISTGCKAEFSDNQIQSLIPWMAELHHSLNSQPCRVFSPLQIEMGTCEQTDSNEAGALNP